jgi:hypothetical protein
MITEPCLERENEVTVNIFMQNQLVCSLVLLFDFIEKVGEVLNLS